MAEGWDVFKRPGAGAAVRIAAAVAADAWRAELSATGLADQQANRILLRLRNLPLPSVTQDEARAFEALLENCLAEAAATDSKLARRIQAAELMIGRQPAETRGAGGEIALVILALSFLLLVAKLKLQFETRHLKISLTRGLPAGFDKTLSAMTKLLKAAVPGSAFLADDDKTSDPK